MTQDSIVVVSLIRDLADISKNVLFSLKNTSKNRKWIQTNLRDKKKKGVLLEAVAAMERLE